MSAGIDRDGYEIVRHVLSREVQEELITALGPAGEAGRRGLLGEPVVDALARSGALLRLISTVLGDSCRPVRAIYFNKTATTNWLVPWHQDLTLAVRSQIDVLGFGPWSVKDGIPHVQAPADFLEKMLTVRLHLDPTDESNGALRVLPGTHRFGKLSSEKIASLRREFSEVVCRLGCGDAMLMRPLILHASSRTTGPRQRRVLHIEYAACDLPAGLEWHMHGR